MHLYVQAGFICIFLYQDKSVLLTEDGSDAGRFIWGQTKFEIMQSCRRKHKLLPSSTFCRGLGDRGWTNVFRVEEVFEIKTGK